MPPYLERAALSQCPKCRNLESGSRCVPQALFKDHNNTFKTFATPAGSEPRVVMPLAGQKGIAAIWAVHLEQGTKKRPPPTPQCLSGQFPVRSLSTRIQVRVIGFNWNTTEWIKDLFI
ncbi:hypothetical protein CDAR_261321 [Caerostris darwini]|uniref:Uncharacterized protein n=1 Tax=Caerostris darwini TaxID=1538125 RepID=A0AAV4SS72_9ARAC|nr:hypothetical protein CDAR_261321 [Caerostris darwini]